LEWHRDRISSSVGPQSLKKVRGRAELRVRDVTSWPGHARKGERSSMTNDCSWEILADSTEVDRNMFEIHVDVGMDAETARVAGTISR
jgi:hypothetical protein